MKKKAQGNTDPRVKKLFKILNSQFKTMEESTPGYKRESDAKDQTEKEVSEK